MMILIETYIDLISVGSRKRQDLLSKLGAWRCWRRFEGGEAWREAEKNVELNKINKKNLKKENLQGPRHKCKKKDDEFKGQFVVQN